MKLTDYGILITGVFWQPLPDGAPFRTLNSFAYNNCMDFPYKLKKSYHINAGILLYNNGYPICSLHLCANKKTGIFKFGFTHGSHECKVSRERNQNFLSLLLEATTAYESGNENVGALLDKLGRT